MYLAFDHRHTGLGGENSWSRCIHPEYRIQPGQYQYRVALRILPER
ncbi:MAG: hypothetical protein LBG76_01830 [Treponema sp.]|nr:hypothetical protein [Treponema sp.]